MQRNNAALMANSDLVTKELENRMRSGLQSHRGWFLSDAKETVGKEPHP